MASGGGAGPGLGARRGGDVKPRVIAHRGAAAERPENTVPAYALALEQGADMIEIDLHRTRDGVVVVLHDAGLERLGGSGEVGEASLAELLTLDAGGGERIPTLDDVLDAFGDRIPFDLELKWGRHGLYEGLEAAVLDAVERRGLLDRTLLSCFHAPVLETLRRAAPAARLALLVSRHRPDGALERARSLGAEAVNPEASLVTPEWVEAAHGEGLAVYPYTVDDEAEMRRLLGWGVDGLFTNAPARLRSLVDSLGG